MPNNNRSRTTTTDSFAVVVNDDRTQLAVFSGLLKKAGLEAQAFDNAEEALSAMDSFAKQGRLPAIVATDLVMPGIDGWRFIRLLRSPQYFLLNDIPVLVVSALFSGDEPESIVSSLGVEGFLSSHAGGEIFIRRIHEIIARQKAQKPRRVLIVESDADEAASLKETFDLHGYRADTAPTCRDALGMFGREAYDLAVIAYEIKDDAGDSLLAPFQRMRPACTLIAMTDNPTPELAVRWMKQGAGAYLHKPFAHDYLLDVCRGALRERRLLQAQEKFSSNIERLLEQQSIHKGILLSAMDGYWLSDGAGKLLEVNDAYCRMSGYTGRELLAMTIADLDVAEDARAVQMHKEKVRRLGADRFETKHRRKDGSLFDVEVSTHHLTVKGLFVTFLHDVTERRRMEQTLVKSESKWKNILADTPQLGLSLNRQGKIVFANNHLLLATGWSREEVLGQDWFALFISKSIRDDMRQYFFSILETGDIARIARYENEIITRNGEMRAIAWANVPTLDADGNIVEVTSLGIDLTERKFAEEALRRSEERLRLALYGADLGIWDWDIEPGALVFDDRWAEMVGYTPEELPPRYETFERLVHPEDLPVVLDAVQAHLRDESDGIVSEFRMRHKSGRWIWVQTRGQVIERDAENRALRVCGTHLDVTARKEGEEEKARLEGQFFQAQKMESVGRLAGGVAHDFNNMLGVILGRAEIALAYDDPTGRYAPHLQEIQKAAQRSADLTRQLLAFARKQTIAPQVLNLNAKVEGMLKMLRRLIGEDIDLVWHPDASSPHVTLDPSQLDQILANLCVNARDAIEKTGVVAIRTGLAFFDEGHCRPDIAPGNYALLSVGDDGCGMDEETLQRIFDPFFTTKESGKGTGLGLATVYGIVRQNSGFIDVRSRPDAGSVFTIYLPLCEVSPEQPKKLSSVNPIVGGNETVLLVEDETANLEIVVAMLRGFGYTVIAAATPAEAVELARQHGGEIDLLLTDVIMPEMNGRDLAHNVFPHCPRARVLFMSGYTADVMARGGVMDADIPFIQKPFSLGALAAKVREALGTD